MSTVTRHRKSMADVLAFLSSIQMHSDFQAIASHFISFFGSFQSISDSINVASTWKSVYTHYVPQHGTVSLKTTIPLFLGKIFWISENINKEMAKVCQTHIQCPNVKFCYQNQSCVSLLQVRLSTSTESPSSWDWNGSREIVQLNPLAQAGSPEASCLGLCPDSLWKSPRRETPQHIWANWCRAQSPFTVKRISWCSERISFAFGPVTKHQWKEFDSASFAPYLRRHLYTVRRSLSGFSSPRWAAPMYSACAQMRDAPVL